jgi:hypothetical protein
MPSPQLPTFPNIDFSKLELPAELGAVATKIGDAAKDAGYITVGLAVLAAQKVNTRRQELRKSLTDQVGNGRSQFAEVVDAVEAGITKLDARLQAVEAKVDGAVETLEKRLPGKAGAALNQAHEVVKVARGQVRSMVVPAA